jgi:hypothetical protein
MTTVSPYRRVTSLKYWLISAGALVVGLLLLYLSGTSWLDKHASVSTLCNQLGGLAIASVAIATLWELAGRRSFFQEMLEVSHLKNDVDTSGLEAVGVDYSKAIDWDAALGSARQVDVFAAWATTWRNTHQAKLAQLVNRPGTKIRICIPDPADANCVRILAARFNYTPQDVENKINETVREYKALDGNSGTGRVEIYTSTAFRAYTAYRIDNHIVVTLYHHKPGRLGSVPVFRCGQGGALFRFFEDDLEGAINASTKLYP